MTRSKIKITNQIRNVFIIPLLLIGHIFYDLGIGYWLFGLAGGVTYHPEEPVFKTYLGGISWAFETPLYAPGSYLQAIHNVAPCTWTGQWELLNLAASILIAIATGQLLQKIINKDNDKFGKFYWRLIIFILGSIFIPVPVEMTMAYEFTVLC